MSATIRIRLVLIAILTGFFAMEAGNFQRAAESHSCNKNLFSKTSHLQISESGNSVPDLFSKQESNTPDEDNESRVSIPFCQNTSNFASTYLSLNDQSLTDPSVHFHKLPAQKHFLSLQLLI